MSKVVYSGSAEGNSKLSNEDFRKLIMTPRASSDEPPTPSRYAHLDPNRSFAKPTTPRTVSSEDADKKKKKFRKKKKEDEQKSKYRDRAAERRDGKTERSDGPAASELPGAFHAVAPTKTEPVKNNQVEIDRSKFLGGDVDHTHLVKGLDFALLAKVKTEIMKDERDKQEAERLKTGKQEKSHKIISTNSGNVTEIEAPKEYQTHVGRRLYETLFLNQRPQTTDMFLPGRMMYVYDLDMENSQDMPTIIKRSKDACPDATQYVVAKTHPEIVNRVSRIMSYYSQGTKGTKKLNKRKREEDELPAKPEQPPQKLKIDDGDSIFDDISSESDVNDPVETILAEAKKLKVNENDDKKTPVTLDVLGVVKPKPEKPEHQQDKVKDKQPDKGKEKAAVGPQLPGPQLPSADNLSAFMEDAYGIPTPKEATTATTTATTKTTTAKTEPSPKPEPKKPLPAADYYFTDTPMSKPTKEKKEEVEQGRAVTDVFRSLGTVLDASSLSAEKKKQRENVEKIQKKLTGIPDEYSECYPGTYEGTGFAEVDNEEEEDLTKMDSRQKLKRWDFESDEQWEEYESQRVAIPKAAFQFGVKTKEGRQTKKAKDQKLKNQLKKIEGIIESREGGDRVLGKRAREDEEEDNSGGGGGGGRKEGGGGGGSERSERGGKRGKYSKGNSSDDGGGAIEVDDPNSYASRLKEKRTGGPSNQLSEFIAREEGAGSGGGRGGGRSDAGRWASRFDNQSESGGEPTTPRFVTDGSLFK